MKRKIEDLQARDELRLKLIETWELSYGLLFGECDGCRNLVLAAIDLAEWTMVDFLLLRPLDLAW